MWACPSMICRQRQVVKSCPRCLWLFLLLVLKLSMQRIILSSQRLIFIGNVSKSSLYSVNIYVILLYLSYGYSCIQALCFYYLTYVESDYSMDYGLISYLDWFSFITFRIHFCTADKNHGKVFAYIARSTENETMECHAFLCQKRKIVSIICFLILNISLWLLTSKFNWSIVVGESFLCANVYFILSTSCKRSLHIVWEKMSDFFFIMSL